MCVAFPTPRGQSKQHSSNWWHQLVSSPVRLFCIAALFYLLLLLLRYLLPYPYTTAIDHFWLLRFTLFFILVPSIVFGLLLSRYPVWIGSRHASPAAVETLFGLFCAGALLMFVGSVVAKAVFMLGLGMIIAAWLWGIRMIRQIHDSQIASAGRTDTFTLWCLMLGLLCLGWVVLGLLSQQAWIDNIAFVGAIGLYGFPLLVLISLKFLKPVAAKH